MTNYMLYYATRFCMLTVQFFQQYQNLGRYQVKDQIGGPLLGKECGVLPGRLPIQFLPYVRFQLIYPTRQVRLLVLLFSAFSVCLFVFWCFFNSESPAIISFEHTLQKALYGSPLTGAIHSFIPLPCAIVFLSIRF